MAWVVVVQAEEGRPAFALGPAFLDIFEVNGTPQGGLINAAGLGDSLSL